MQGPAGHGRSSQFHRGLFPLLSCYGLLAFASDTIKKACLARQLDFHREPKWLRRLPLVSRRVDNETRDAKGENKWAEEDTPGMKQRAGGRARQEGRAAGTQGLWFSAPGPAPVAPVAGLGGPDGGPRWSRWAPVVAPVGEHSNEQWPYGAARHG